MPEDVEKKILVAHDNARKFVHGVLVCNGVPADSAEIVARCLIEADLRGVDTHGQSVIQVLLGGVQSDKRGANRIPSYMQRIRNKVLDPAARPVLKEVTPVVFQVDGQNCESDMPAPLCRVGASHHTCVRVMCVV
jgi:LDH2 family malate/lactate/ureidoglycolate dehydrogenase